MTITIAECWIYPLKSAQGIRVDKLELTSRGPINDRLWMLVQDQGAKHGKFISQRDKGCEKLSIVGALPQNDETTKFVLPDGQQISVNNSGLARYDGQVTVHKDTCDALDAGDEAAQFFSNYLNQACRLVRMPDDFIRPTDPKYSRPGDNVGGYADGFSLLATNLASLSKLAEHFPQNTNVTMQEFRPNMVLKGAVPFEEDTIGLARTENGVVLGFTKPCARCSMTTVDQSTGISTSNEPMTTLAKARNGNAEGLGGAFFGQNVILRELGSGIIRVGDEVEILSRREPHPALQNAVLRYDGP